MTIEAVVLGEEPGTNYGLYRFIELPRSGDRIVVGNNRGSCDILVVRYVEHSPVRQPPSRFGYPDPSVRVITSYHSSFGEWGEDD